MKIICIRNNFNDNQVNKNLIEEPVFYFKPDTALLIKNRPFYIPHFSKNITCEVALLIKINKSGRSIDENFAHNYFQDIGIGVNFIASDLKKELMQNSQPWDKSLGFDYSAAISEFFNKNIWDIKQGINFKMFVNNTKIADANSNNMILNFNKIIAGISKYLTLRTGDIIFTGSPAKEHNINIGDRIETYINEKKFMNFIIK